MTKRACLVVIVLFLCALIFSLGSTKAEERITLLVFDLEGVNMEAGEAEMLSETLRVTLFGIGKYNLVDRKLLESVVKEHKFGQSGLATPEKLAELGKALKAQKIITGSIGHMGSIYQISLKLLDIETITYDNYILEKCFQCSKEQLFSLVSNAALKLVGIQSSATPEPQPPPQPQPQPPPQPYQPPAPQPSGNVNFSGTWESTFGLLVLNQTGNQVTGTYRYKRDKKIVTGTVVNGVVSGNRLTFKWIEAASVDSDGDGYYVMSDDGRSFTGKWRTGYSGPWRGNWTGIRK